MTKFPQQISRCYDSHVHFQATAEVTSRLDLHHLSCEEDVRKIQVQAQHYRGDWLIGFGWDQNRWSGQAYPSKKILDELFPTTPVCFTRADGHAAWVNSEALKRIGYYNKTESEKATPAGGVIVRDSQGFPSGVLIDMAKMQVDYILPPLTKSQQKEFLLQATRIFNQAGFTHARDMGSHADQWNLLMELEDQNALTIYLEQNFPFENMQDLIRALDSALYAKKHEASHLRVAGVKFFFDGALGSEGAYLSQNYAGSQNRGFTLWSLVDVKEILRICWQNQMPVAIHVIGDAAADLIVDAALEVTAQGFKGLLHLEHVQVLRTDTIAKMRKLNVICHVQPCHWLSDRIWLKQKLGSLYPSVFPWGQLEKFEIPFDFGSDSPIEKPSIIDNFRAIEESPVLGIPALKKDFAFYHSHPDLSWGKDCYSIFDKDRLSALYFDGRRLI